MRNYNNTLYALIAILVIYTVAFVGFIMYSITNFAFADFYKRLDLRRNLAAEHMFNGKGSHTGWSLTYVEELNNSANLSLSLTENHRSYTQRALIHRCGIRYRKREKVISKWGILSILQNITPTKGSITS